MKSIVLPIGDKYGRLEVISNEGVRNRHMYYKCRCECGKEIITRGSALVSCNTKSCGCLNKQKGKNIILGYKIPMDGSKTNGKLSIEYNTYRHIKARCYTKSNPKYKNYGGRGIRVCDRWLESFENFYADMGKRPEHFDSIERNDVNGDYEPGNCRWATDQEQAVNKTNTVRLVVNGNEIHQTGLAKLLGVCPHSISNHLRKGETGDEIVEYFKNKNQHASTI